MTPLPILSVFVLQTLSQLNDENVLKNCIQSKVQNNGYKRRFGFSGSELSDYHRLKSINIVILCLGVYLSWGQFHQHFTRLFFVRKQYVQLFSNYSLAL